MTGSSGQPDHNPAGPPFHPPPATDSYPPPYPYAGYPPPPPYHGPRNGLGTASLAFAIAGLVTAVSVMGGVALGIGAVVLGFLGYGRVKRRQADNGGVAIAGIVLGVLAILAGIACIFIYAAIWKTVGGGDYVDCMTKAGSDPTAQQQCADRFREHFENRFGDSLPPPAPPVQPGSASSPA